VSADVLTRPVLKSVVLPVAASVLGPSEIAYHAQSLTLFPIFDAPLPVLLPRTFLVVRGAAERRAAQALGVADEDLLAPRAAAREAAVVPQADRVCEIAQRLDAEMATLAPEVEALDPTLAGALETARRKAAYQLEQLGERMRKAAERKDEVALARRRRLETMLLPGGELGTRGSDAIRRKEAERAAEILGAEFRETLDFGDGRISGTREQELSVVDLIRRERPRLILTSYPEDRHPDHARAGRLVTDL